MRRASSTAISSRPTSRSAPRAARARSGRERSRSSTSDWRRRSNPELEARSVGASHSPTLTLQATMRGEILGTAAYMSPEQAQGLPADERADIWAFGVCLLEALSGRRVFNGANASFVLASVLKDEPDLDALPPTTPPVVRRLLRRCLEKNRERRLDDIADARLELEDVLATPARSPRGRASRASMRAAGLGCSMAIAAAESSHTRWPLLAASWSPETPSAGRPSRRRSPALVLEAPPEEMAGDKSRELRPWPSPATAVRSPTSRRAPSATRASRCAASTSWKACAIVSM